MSQRDFFGSLTFVEPRSRGRGLSHSVCYRTAGCRGSAGDVVLDILLGDSAVRAGALKLHDIHTVLFDQSAN